MCFRIAATHVETMKKDDKMFDTRGGGVKMP